MYRTLAAVVFLSTLGCSGPPAALRPRTIDAAEAATKGVSLYDSNGDGAIDAQEIKKSPALISAVKSIDTNGDGKLSADEIAARIRSWSERGTAFVDYRCRVTLNGRPLAGAVVALEPDASLQGLIPSASGETDAQGYAMPTMAKDQLPNAAYSGVAPGWYSVRVSKPGNDKLLPARYATGSEFGIEVNDTPDLTGNGDLSTFRMTSP
jgi:hypothetical protein